MRDCRSAIGRSSYSRSRNTSRATKIYIGIATGTAGTRHRPTAAALAYHQGPAKGRIRPCRPRGIHNSANASSPDDDGIAR